MPLALALLVIYLFIASAVLRAVEKNMLYYEAFYFNFVSLSTIGEEYWWWWKRREE